MPEFDFGHFHIVGELGRGGMALVYEAVDTRTDETVALKILYPHLMSDGNNIKRFQREAKVATRLRHKYIVPVIDFGEHDDQIYIAMQYMSGNSLAELFAEPRSIKMKGIIRILGEVASALDYAHTQGVIHRDLKLQNILLDDKRHAYLADFGIARLVDGTRLTATGQIAGTPMYMSPEQIRGKPVDHRSDIYSFSVMSYLLLTGYYPFTGEDSLSIIHKHVKEFPPTPTEVNTDLPESVDGVLLRGLMKLPKDRYDTAMDMVKALYSAVNTPELHQSSTRIDIRAINPVDSVEMDAPANVVDSRIQSPTGTVQQPPLQSDLSSAVVTGSQTLQGTGSRVGIFGIAFFGLAVVAILILLVILVLGGGNQDNAQVVLNNAQTQAYQQSSIDSTSTAQSEFIIQLTAEEEGEEDDDNEDDVNTSDLPPTWTLTPNITATLTPTPAQTEIPAEVLTAFPEADAQIVAINGAPVITGPGPSQETLATLPNGTYVQIVGKTGLDDFWEIVTADGIQGYVSILLIETDVDIKSIQNTYYPESPPNGRQNDGGNNNPPPPRENSGG